MRTIRLLRRCRTVLAGFLLAGVAAGAPGVAQAQLPNDPVADLQATLKERQGAAAREAALKQKVARLHSIGDLHRALALDDWSGKEGVLSEEDKVDQRYRTQIANRYLALMRASLESGDALRQIAAANLLNDLGSSLRGVDPQNRGGLNRELAPDLVKAMQSGKPQVRTAATRALASINPAAKVAVPALGEELRARDVGLRRAAAASLGNLLQRLTALISGKAKAASGVTARRLELINTASLALPELSNSLNDPDAEVRRLSLEGVRQAALGMSGLAQEFTLVDRAFTPADQKEKEEEQAKLPALAKKLGEQAPKLVRALKDPDPAIRLLARKTLEEFGEVVRRQQQNEAAAAPLPREEIPAERKPGGTEGQEDDSLALARREARQAKNAAPAEAPLVRSFDETLRPLLAGLNDPDPAVRLATVEVLEMFGDAAKPAAPALVRAVADPDLFVRWAAGRTLGKLAPVDAATAVPALAGLLRERDLDLRLIGAGSLEKYGPDAKAAVPALARTAGEGDAEIRRAAMMALAAIGPDAKQAVPSVTAQLANENARVRTTAAEVLGRFGPLARAAEGALRKAMSDDDADVRRAASDALLNILPAPEREK